MSALLNSSLSGYLFTTCPSCSIPAIALRFAPDISEFDNPSVLFRVNTSLNTSCLLSTFAYPRPANRYVHPIVCPLRGGNAGRGAGRGREAFRICDGKRSPPQAAPDYMSSWYTAPYPAASSSLMPSFSISSAGMKSEIIIGGFVASAVSAICASSGDM